MALEATSQLVPLVTQTSISAMTFCINTGGSRAVSAEIRMQAMVMGTNTG